MRYRAIREAISISSPLPRLAPLVDKMKQAGAITNSDYRIAFGVDRRTARRALAELVTTGVLVQEGEKRGTRYKPGGRWPGGS